MTVYLLSKVKERIVLPPGNKPPVGFDAQRDLGYSFLPPFPPTVAGREEGSPLRVQGEALLRRCEKGPLTTILLLWCLFTFWLFLTHYGFSSALFITVVNLLLTAFVRGEASDQRGRKLRNMVFMAVGLLVVGRNLTGLFFLLLSVVVLWGSFLRTGRFLGGGGVGKAYQGKRLADYGEACLPTWGIPGKTIGNVAQFGSNGALGREGEERVGKALNSLQARYPFMRVFHSLRYVPNSDKPWDVDHMVLIGNTIYFVDAKAWLYGSYQWAPDGRQIYIQGRNGQQEVREVSMADALNYWRSYLPRDVVLVGARITLAQANPQGYFINQQNNQGLVQLVTLPQLLAELEAHAQQATPMVDRRLVASLASQLMAA